MRCGPGDWAVVTGWQKLLLGLAVFLPIPMLAMSGLAVPLPAAVYRAATAFVESTQGFAGVLSEGDAKPLAPAPLASIPAADRPVVEPSSPRRNVAAPKSPVRVRVRGAAPVAVPVERTSTVTGRRSSRTAPTLPVVQSVRAEPAQGAEATTVLADPGAQAAAPTSPTRSKAPSRAVEVPRAEPLPAPVSPPPAPSPPPPSPPPPALEPVTKAVEPVTRVLDPVTKPLEPVTKIVEPVTKPVTDVLDPITAPVLKTGRLLGP